MFWHITCTPNEDVRYANLYGNGYGYQEGYSQFSRRMFNGEPALPLVKPNQLVFFCVSLLIGWG